MKPVVLVPRHWGRRIALEVEVEKADAKMIREIRKVKKVSSSNTLTTMFLLLARSGAASPSELSEKLAKSKFVVSQELAKLKEASLVAEVGRAKSENKDMRRRRYDLNTATLVEIFRRDHALELSLYRNHIVFDEANLETRGTITRTELAIFGNRKLGVVREVNLDRNLSSVKSRELVVSRMEKLYSEFLLLFRAYLVERNFGTIRDYYLGLYRELSIEYRRLPKKSELASFYNFLDRSMSKIKPIDYLWKKYASSKTETLPKSRGSEQSGDATQLLLFTEAGKTDSTGKYILNGEARGLLRPGLKTRIYPSFTFTEI